MRINIVLSHMGCNMKYMMHYMVVYTVLEFNMIVWMRPPRAKVTICCKACCHATCLAAQRMPSLPQLMARKERREKLLRFSAII